MNKNFNYLNYLSSIVMTCVNHEVFEICGRNTSYVILAINQLYLRKNLVYYDVNITGSLGGNLYVCISPLT